MNSDTLSTGGNRDTKQEKITVNGETEILQNMNAVDVKNEEIMLVEIARKTGVSFPVKLTDGKELKAIGVRKKNMLGLSFKIYSFGMYFDNQKLMGVLKSKVVKAEAKGTKEMYKMVIDNPVGITVKMVIVLSNLSMSMVRKNFNESIGESIRKLGGGKNNELTKRVMGEAKDDIKLTRGSEIEVTCLPGYVLETKVHGKVVNKFESEMLCRAYVYLFLGDDPFDKEAKEKFGMSLLSLF